METLLEQLREVLGLDDEASADEVLAAVRELAAGGDDDDDGDGGADEAADTAGDRDGADVDAMVSGRAGGAHQGGGADPARYVAVAQFQKVLSELNELRAARAGERAERAVDDAIKAGKLIPAQRQWAISYCQADFKGFAAFVARQPAAFGAGFESAAATFTSQPPSSSAGALTAAESAICTQLGLGAQEYLRRKRSGRGDFLRLNRGGE